MRWTQWRALDLGTATMVCAESPLVDLKTAIFEGTTHTDAGAQCRLSLPAKRSNWTSPDWKVCTLPASVKLSGTVLRLTVKTDQPRGDVGVYVAVRVVGGGWYCHSWAANLTQPRQ